MTTRCRSKMQFQNQSYHRRVEKCVEVYKKYPTLAEVSRACGVSLTTIHLHENDVPGVREMREHFRIERANRDSARTEYLYSYLPGSVPSPRGGYDGLVHAWRNRWAKSEWMAASMVTEKEANDFIKMACNLGLLSDLGGWGAAKADRDLRDCLPRT